MLNAKSSEDRGDIACLSESNHGTIMAYLNAEELVGWTEVRFFVFVRMFRFDYERSFAGGLPI